MAQNFLGVISHLMQTTGIEDILVEAQICLRGRANKIISGKNEHAMLRAHSMVHAAIFTLHWKAFEKWMMDQRIDLDCMSSLRLESSYSPMPAYSDTTKPLKKVVCLMEEFDKTCTPPTAKRWLMYMDVMVLKRYVHAE